MKHDDSQSRPDDDGAGAGAADPTWWSASRVAAAVRAGELGARDYLERLIDRVDRLDGPLNTVVTLDLERARRRADAADLAVRRGDPLGPLHGVSMTIKDSFQTGGLRTTSGAPELRDFVPESDAVPVARLRASGAIVFGKTNLPIWAGDTQSYNEVFGTSNNPWDLTRTVGGSSGGAAGALAAGFTPLELGSDIGGSIRGPASTCGITGHKPSFGIVPAIGQIPGLPGTLSQADLAVAGPMARTVDDLELALDVLAGPDDWEGTAWDLQLPPARHERVEDYRIAVWLDEPSAPIAAEIRELIVGAAESLAEAGARVDFDARPDFEFDYASRTYLQLLGAAECGGFSHDEIERMAEQPDSEQEGLVPGFYTLRHRAWLSANERRLQMRRKWRDFFGQWDAVLLPVLPTDAIPHDHSEPMAARRILVDGVERPYLDQLLWVGFIGAAYLPATVVPIGRTSAGLPVGIQIAGPYLEDRTTLALARHLETRLGGFAPPPGF